MNVLNEQSERTPTRPDQSRLLASVLRMYPFASRPLKVRRAASIQLRGRAVVVRRNFKTVPAVLIIFASIPRPPRSEPRAARPPRGPRRRPVGAIWGGARSRIPAPRTYEYGSRWRRRAPASTRRAIDRRVVAWTCWSVRDWRKYGGYSYHTDPGGPASSSACLCSVGSE